MLVDVCCMPHQNPSGRYDSEREPVGGCQRARFRKTGARCQAPGGNCRVIGGGCQVAGSWVPDASRQ
eukprot:9737836-Alexandrium_andersonii.AAC.1